MLQRIIQWSAENRLLVFLLTALIAAAGVWAMVTTPVDAIPDLSDVQVIIQTDYPGQGPQIVEEQITYPLTTAMLSVPFAKTVRGYSMFGTSFVYVIFEDGADMYWARSRVLEYLNYVGDRLPEGVRPAIGPDATGVGWVYQYSLSDTSGTLDLAQLRTIQDFFLRYELQAVEGVSEIATIGGFQKQYQVVVDPQKLAAFGVSLERVKTQLQNSNRDVGGRVVEMGEREFIVRGKGYLQNVDHIRSISLSSSGGTSVTIGDVANVQIGPELRRGIAEKNGEGEVVGGIVVMRSGENARKVIARVKERIEELKPGLPDGVEIHTEYDRSGLIDRAITTLTTQIGEELLVVSLIVFLFLLHARSAIVALVTVPVGILISLLVMKGLGVNANIMSLGGIAIAIGVMVDASLVMVENAHKHLERLRPEPGIPGSENGSGPVAGGPEPELPPAVRVDAVLAAAKEVGPSLFFSLLIVTISFLPVFSLEQVEGRMFTPLALTKTFAMAAAALLAVTLVPALMVVSIRGRIRAEHENPIARFFTVVYRPVIRWTLRRPAAVMAIAAVALLLTVLPIQRMLFGTAYVPFPQLGSEFMPTLNEGDILYMPTTLPGVSSRKAGEILQQTDRIIKSFPEVESVFGKIGRAETATDPAPMSMIETIITLKPRNQWREGVTWDRLVSEMDAAIQIPGLTNAWTMPIKTRTDMLATGIKTPVGVKIAGADLRILEDLGTQVERVLEPLEGTLSVYAERVMGGSFLDIEIRRSEAARYGLTTGDVQNVIASAVGGMNVTTMVEGLERYPVNVRYPRDFRGDLSAIRQVLVATPDGAQIPLGQLADLQISDGPQMIKSENARPNAWVYVDLESNVDVGTYVQRARQVVSEAVAMPPGYSVRWSGQYEYMERANQRLQILIPLTLAIIFILLFLHFRNVWESSILMATLPLAVVGAVWLMAILEFNMSIAVGVGFIAVAGLAAETGVVMQVYLDEAVARYRREGRMSSRAMLSAALEEGAVDRLRPKLMTVFTTLIGLMPIMLGTGTGSEVMRRIATPMVGGLVSSTALTLIVIPAAYMLVQSRRLRGEFEEEVDTAPDRVAAGESTVA